MNTYKKYCKICEAITQHYESKRTHEIQCSRCLEINTVRALHDYEEEMKYIIKENKNET